MRLNLLLCLLPLFLGPHALTPQLSKTSDLVIPSKQSELENSSAPLSQIVTFPNMVKMTELSQPEPTEVSKIEALLKSEGIDLENLDTGADFQSQKLAARGLFVAQFITKPSRKMLRSQIIIPATGSFQVRLTEGPVFRIMDQDATNGSALIQMPAAVFNTWLKLSQNRGQNSSLEIEDQLYYLKDIVNSQKQNVLGNKTLFSIGLRPLPVPGEWLSPYGENLVLNFTTKDVSFFQMIWLCDDEKPADPPFGIKEIGPEGGTVELPGVGKIEIPSGALDEPVTIRLSQKQEHPLIIEGVNRDINQTYYYEYMGPILKIEPLGLKLKKNALVYLSFSEENKSRLGNNSPNILNWVYFSNDSKPGFIKGFLFSESQIDSVVSPISFNAFSYITRVISQGITPSSNMERTWPKQNPFSTKQSTATCPQ